MEPDIFNEFVSDDGSPYLGRTVVISACNEQESSSSPFFSAGTRNLTEKRAERISNDIYREKYRRLKKVVKGFVFVRIADLFIIFKNIFFICAKMFITIVFNELIFLIMLYNVGLQYLEKKKKIKQLLWETDVAD